jgi:hypothetical protein
MSQIIHRAVVTCFNPLLNLPLISNPWLVTTVLNETISLKDKDGANIHSNSILIECETDTWIVIDSHAYPCLADSGLSISLKDVTSFQIIGAIGTKFRWIAMSW